MVWFVLGLLAGWMLASLGAAVVWARFYGWLGDD